MPNRQKEKYSRPVKAILNGHWYLRTINMVKSTESGVDYESNWAKSRSLCFWKRTGLAIVPLLYGGVVTEYAWLNE